MSEYPLDWSIGNLGAYIQETKERAGDSDATPYSVSKVLGIVPQSEKFNKRVASNDISNYKVIREGDFAYDPMLLWDGSINRMLREGEGAVSPAYVTFRVSSNSLDPEYLLHLLKASTTKNFYKSISKGTNVRRQKAEFRDFAAGDFSFPPLPEQRKIAEILSGIDYCIQQQEIEAAKYELLIQATLHEYPSRHAYGHILLKDCANLQAGGTPDRGQKRFWRGNIPWVKTGEVNYNLITKTEEYISEEGLHSSSAKLLPAGSILMAMYGQGVTRGRVARLGISASTNQACLAINSSDPRVGNDYLYWILASKYEHLRGQV